MNRIVYIVGLVVIVIASALVLRPALINGRTDPAISLSQLKLRHFFLTADCRSVSTVGRTRQPAAIGAPKIPTPATIPTKTVRPMISFGTKRRGWSKAAGSGVPPPSHEGV